MEEKIIRFYIVQNDSFEEKKTLPNSYIYIHEFKVSKK